jgi:hypothetical protein
MATPHQNVVSALRGCGLLRTRSVRVPHERKSRMILAASLAGKTAAETISVMLEVFARIAPALRKWKAI